VSLADLLAPPPPRPGCPVARLDLDAEDRKALAAAVLDPRVSGRQIHEALRKSGYTVGAEAVAKHKKGRCDCARPS
jgi:hypothetical protein